MPLYEPVIPARYGLVLIDTVRALDASAVRLVLAAGGLTLRDLHSRSAALAIGQFDRLIDAAVTQVQRNDLGFEYGQRLGIDSHAALGMVLRRCRTGHELLSMMNRYWRLTTTCFFIQYRRSETGGEVIFRPIAPMSSLTLHVMEEMFAVSFHTDFMKMTGNQTGLLIELSQSQPSHLARYKELLPTKFRFSSGSLPQARCVLTTRLLDSELTHPQGSDSTVSTIDQLADDTPARTRQCAELVRLILESAEGVQPDMHAIAEWLDLSPRSLIRHLAAEGCSLRELGASIRYRRACDLLLGSAQPIGQISQRLGYGSVIAFSTAFKQRAGMSPRAFRNAS